MQTVSYISIYVAMNKRECAHTLANMMWL